MKTKRVGILKKKDKKDMRKVLNMRDKKIKYCLHM